MLWQNVISLEEINRFVVLARSGRFYLTDLCEQFGFSCKTGDQHQSVIPTSRWDDP